MAEDIQSGTDNNTIKDDFSAFDNALKSNTVKDDFSAFDNALKKKDNIPLKSSATPSPLALPKKTWLQQGNEIANNSLLKNISKQATEKSKYIPQSKEEEGSWGNIAQNLVDKTFETAAKLGKGAIDLYRSISPIEHLTGIKLHKDLYDENGDLTEHGKSVESNWRNDPTGALALGLNGIKNIAQEDLKYNKLPDSYAGRSVDQILSMGTDVAATALLPEARLAEGAGLVAKAGNILINNFTKYLATKNALEAIGTAKESGKTDNEALWEGVKGGAEGTKQGAEMALIGFGSGKATGAIMKSLEKAGLTGTKGMVTKELVNTITDGIGYSLIQPTIDAGLKGHLPTKEEMISGIAPTVVFRLKDIIHNAHTNAELNDAIKEIQAAKQGSAITNFIQATPESILHAHSSSESADELNAKALELIKKSKETTDINKKHDLVAQAIILTKSANVKHVADVVLKSPDVINEFNNSDLPDDVKEQFVQKANELKPLLEKNNLTQQGEKNFVIDGKQVTPEEFEQATGKSANVNPIEDIKTTETSNPAEEVKTTEENKPNTLKVLDYVVEDRDKVEPILDKIKNNELVNEDDLYNAAQVLENLRDKHKNDSFSNLINPVIDKILTYENQSKTTTSEVTEKGSVTRAGTDVTKKEVSKSLGQFEGSRATIKDAEGKEVTGYLKSENGKYHLYDEDGNKVAAIGEKQITDRDVVLPSEEKVPNPIEFDKDGNVKSITLQLQKVGERGAEPDKLITINFKNAEQGLDYAIKLRAEQIGEFSDPEFEQIVKQVQKEVKIEKPEVNTYNEAKSLKKKQEIVKNELKDLSEEDKAIVDELGKEDLDKIAESNFDSQTFKNIKDAIQKPSTEEVFQRKQGKNGSTGGGRRQMEPGVEGTASTTEGEVAQSESTEKQKTGTTEGLTGVTHAETSAMAEKLGLPEYEKDKESIEEWDNEADRRIQKDKNTIPNLIKKLESGQIPDKVEQRIMAKYLASLSAKLDINPTDSKLLSDYQYARNLSDKIAGTEAGKTLAARKGLVPIEDTIGDFMLNEMEKLGVDQLTDKQKTDIIKEFNTIKSAKEEAEAKLFILAEENAKLKAQQELNKAKKQEKTSIKKSKEDIIKEREDIKKSIKDNWKKASKDNTLTAVPVPYAKQLAAIAPDVAKLVKSYAAEGIDNLNDVVKKIVDDIKEFIPEITDKDVNAIIAGEYNKKRETKNELAAKVKDLKDEAKLVSKLDSLLNGEEPKEERKKIERNKQITDLRKQISELKKDKADAEKEPEDKTKLKSVTNRLNEEAAKLEKRLKEGDYDVEEKKVPLLSDNEVKKKFPKEFKDAQDAREKLENLKKERQVRLLKEEYANRSKLQKAKDFGLEVLNLPRTIMSSMDFSAPLRQGLLATVSHPILAAKAGATMFEHAFSKKSFDKWFTDLRETKAYKIMEDSKLYVADPHDIRLSAKEEAFMNNMAEKIPIIGKMIKGSERAYVSYLNKMRVDLFRQYAEVLESQGKTFENSPELYKGVASFVNNATGRGGLHEKFETAAPLLNGAFFSPRLIASRLNVLGLSDVLTGGNGFYGKMPKEVRVMAMKDILKFVGVGMSVLALAKLNGAKVEDDPRSSDFGKIVDGKTHYDIWGGFQQYIRLIAQITTGKVKQPNTGKIKELGDKHSPFGKTKLDVASSFVRGKLAPIPSMVVDALAGKTAVGEKTTLKGEAMSHLSPLIFSDVKDAYDDQGVKAIFKVGIPSAFGVGVQTYDNKKRK